MLTFLGIIIFVMGMLVGFLSAVALYAFEYILDYKRSVKIPRKLLERKLRELPVARGGGAVLMPETDQAIAHKAIIEKNRLEGRETKLSDL